ncbi:MAG: glutathione S-transferase family protein, partial [Caulobacteraceae bacterium]
TEAFTAKGRLLFEKVMDDIEARLTGTWALGDRYTIADIYILPFHLWANRIGVPTAERHPQTTAWMRRMAARPAVREAVDIEGLDWSLLGGPPE